MSILSGFLKTIRYRKTAEGYIKQSEWTNSDTVEFTDGTTLTNKITDINNDISTIKNKTLMASDINAGTFAGNVSVPASTSYEENQLRNTVFTTEDPGSGATVSQTNGSIICVYE